MSPRTVPRLPLPGGRGPRDPGLAGDDCPAAGWCQRVCAEEEGVSASCLRRGDDCVPALL